MDFVAVLACGGTLISGGSSIVLGAQVFYAFREMSLKRSASALRLECDQNRLSQSSDWATRLKVINSHLKQRFSNGERSRESFDRALISLADELSDGLGAGKSFSQSIFEAASPKDPALSVLHAKMTSRIAYGESPEKVFKEISASTENATFKTLGIATSVQYGAGGNLRELLNEFSAHQREQLLFRQNLKTQTAQGRLSVKIVGFVPPAMLCAMSLLMPGYLDVFFSSPAGKLMLATALLLDGIGFFLVYRLMRVPV